MQSVILSHVQGMMRGEELSQAYASGDVFVMPSESETLGFVVLEAMASQVPVVAVAAGGLTDIITSPGLNGMSDHHILFLLLVCHGVAAFPSSLLFWLTIIILFILNVSIILIFILIFIIILCTILILIFILRHSAQLDCTVLRDYSSSGTKTTPMVTERSPFCLLSSIVLPAANA
jgi:hypothetical protein